MAGKSKAPPQPAYVEDLDEDSHDVLPHSRLTANSANSAAKIHSRLDLRFPAEPLIDGASDSGYSSRTAATANSTQSGPSGERSPPVLHKQDVPKRGQVDLARRPSSRKERRDKERARPTRDEKMHTGAYPGAVYHQSHVQRSPSKSRRREYARITKTAATTTKLAPTITLPHPSRPEQWTSPTTLPVRPCPITHRLPSELSLPARFLRRIPRESFY
jgi:hypothetical protein